MLKDRFYTVKEMAAIITLLRKWLQSLALASLLCVNSSEMANLEQPANEG